MEIESMSECDSIQEYLQTLTGGRSVPRVFVGGKFIGGGDDTEVSGGAGVSRRGRGVARGV